MMLKSGRNAAVVILVAIQAALTYFGANLVYRSSSRKLGYDICIDQSRQLNGLSAICSIYVTISVHCNMRTVPKFGHRPIVVLLYIRISTTNVMVTQFLYCMSPFIEIFVGG